MDGYVTIGTELDTKSFDAQIEYVKSQLDEIEHKLKQADMGYEVGDVQKLEAEYEKLSSKLSTLVRKKQELEKTDLSGIKKGVDEINKGIGKTIKNVARWALGVFAIRSAYLFVRNAINTIAQDDEQLNADLNYIKTALAYTIEPLVRKIVEWARMILQYVGFIIQQWTGKNIFANANKNLEKSKKSAKALNKELSKTVAKFDEMNVVGSTSGGDTATSPSFTLGDYSNMQLPEWVKWIADNKDIVLGFLQTLGVLLVALKLGDILKTLGLFGELPLWQVVGGLALIIAGVGLAIEGVLDFIKEPTWQNFLKILEGIALVVAGIAVLMGGWVVALIALGVAIVAYVIQNWNTVKEILGAVGTWIYDHIIKPVGDFFAGMWNGFKEGAKKAWEGIKSIFGSVASFFKSIFTTAWEGVKAVFSTGGKIFTGLTEGILEAFKRIVNVIIDGINKVVAIPFNGINSAFDGLRSVDLWGWKPFEWVPRFKVPQIPKLAKGGILNNPGKGVYVGGAIAGEAGKELYMPLENEQMLDLVGEAIGRRISLTATIPVYVGNRQIVRETKKIELQDNFAFNR